MKKGLTIIGISIGQSLPNLRTPQMLIDLEKILEHEAGMKMIDERLGFRAGGIKP